MPKPYTPPCAWEGCAEPTGDPRSKYCKTHRHQHRLRKSHDHYVKTRIEQEGQYPRICQRCKKRPAARLYCDRCRVPQRREYRKRREEIIHKAIAGDVNIVLQHVSIEIDKMRLGISVINRQRLEYLAKVLTSIRIDETMRNRQSEIYQRVRRGHPAVR